MPPNGWNCRCTTVEVLASDYSKSDSSKAIAAGEKATTQIGKNGKNKAEMFRFNPGKEKKIFPPKNAYTPKHCNGGKVDMSRLIGVASIVLSLEDEKCQAQRLLEEEAKALKRKKSTEIFSKPINQQYKTIYKSKSGGSVEVHELVNRDSRDHNAKIEAAKLFSSKGMNVKILPEIHTSEKKFRKKIFPNYEHFSKNPDYLIDGKYYDLKRPEKANNIVSNANSAYRQRAIAIISDDQLELKEDLINKVSKTILLNNEFYKYDQVYFVMNQKLKVFKVEQGVIISE